MEACRIKLSHWEEFIMVNAYCFVFINPVPLMMLIAYFLLKFNLFALQLLPTVKRRSIYVLGYLNIFLFCMAALMTFLDIGF